MSQQIKNFTKEEKLELLKQLGDISPQWSQYLLMLTKKIDFVPPPEHLNLLDPKTCLAGEANGFSSSYVYFEDLKGLHYNTPKSCKKCDRFGDRFYEIIDVASEINYHESRLNYVWGNLENFINHWNKVHRK